MSEESRLDAAEDLMERGDPVGAAKLCYGLLRSNDPALLVRVGKLLVRLEDLASAKAAYRRSVTLNPRLASAHSALGVVAFDEGNTAEAIQHLKRAVELEPTDIDKLVMLGVFQTEDNSSADEGLRLLEFVLTLDPDNSEAHYNIGVTLRNVDPGRAEHHFREAIKNDPEYVEALRELGYLLAGLNRFDEAEARFSAVDKMDPEDAWNLVYWGTARWQQGDAEGSRTYFERAAKSHPEWALPLWSLGALEEEVGNFSKARSLYELAVSIDPDDEVARSKLDTFRSRYGDKPD